MITKSNVRSNADNDPVLTADYSMDLDAYVMVLVGGSYTFNAAKSLGVQFIMQ